MTQPLNDGDLDKIFGINSPDFSGGESVDHDSPDGDGVVACCHYHFLQWLGEQVKRGVILTEEQKEESEEYLKQIQRVLLQRQDEEDQENEEEHPMAKALEDAGLGSMAEVLKKMTSGILFEGKTESGDLTFQVLTDGVRLLSGGKSLKLRPHDAVVLGGAIGGWVWESEKMRQTFLDAIKESKGKFSF